MVTKLEPNHLFQQRHSTLVQIQVLSVTDDREQFTDFAAVQFAPESSSCDRSFLHLGYRNGLRVEQSMRPVGRLIKTIFRDVAQQGGGQLHRA